MLMYSGRWYEDKINASSVYTFKCQPKYMAPSVTLCEAMIQYLQYSDTITKNNCLDYNDMVHTSFNTAANLS